MIELLLDQIGDPIVRENFQKLFEPFRSNPFLANEWKQFELTLGVAKTGYRFKHFLKFVPKDVIITNVSPESETVTVKYDQIDATNIVFDTTGPVTFRFVVGNMKMEEAER